MDDLEVRQVREDEWPAVLELSRITFGEEYTDDDARAFFPAFPFDRSLGAFDAGTLVGLTAVLPLQLTLPGGNTISMGGLTWVGVLPTHRRRGILRRLMHGQFEDMANRGEAVSGLGASEGSIYGRYGYGPATSAISFAIERPYARLLPTGRKADNSRAPGRMSLLTREQAAAQIPAIYDRLRLSQPGATDRPASLWFGHFADTEYYRAGASRMYHVKHEGRDGVADGYVSYRLKENWIKEAPMLEVKVVEYMAADAGVYRDLWDYLLNTDLSRTISCSKARVDEPLRWLLADPRRFTVTALYDSLWLRLLDMPRALSARAYRAAGRLILEVHDPFPVPMVHNLQLEVTGTGSAGDGAAECTCSSRPADLSLDAGTLAAAYLGGVSFGTLRSAGRIRENTPGAVELADAMFSVATAPFCSTDF